MASRNPRTPRAFLAREIQRAREAKEMSREQLAKALFVSESLVRSWERDIRLIQPDHLKQVEELVGLAVLKGILSRMREELIKNGPSPEWVGKWLEIEEQATSLLWYQPLIIPGLLQTADYARAVIISSGRQVDNLEEQVEARLERQKILLPESGLMFVAIIDEGVLHRPIGGPKTLHDQLVKVLDLAKQPNIIVQVVPIDVGGYPGLAGGFGLAAMDGQEYAYVDDVFSGEILEHPDDVAVIKRIWMTLHNEALPGRQSIELIERAVERWKT
jgi:transcriptional regulator with XRE-family HTH domain